MAELVGIEFAEFDYQIYNALGALGEVSAEDVIHDDLSALGKIILKHGLEHDVGVSLLHSHHTITKDEKIVRSQTLPGTIEVAPKNTTDELYPIHWMVAGQSDQMKVMPVEYIDDTIGGASLENAKRIGGNTAFFNDVANEIARMGKENQLGVMSLHAFNALNIPLETSMIAEYNDTNSMRASVLKFFEESVESGEQNGGITALWSPLAAENGTIEMTGKYICFGCSVVQTVDQIDE